MIKHRAEDIRYLSGTCHAERTIGEEVEEVAGTEAALENVIVRDTSRESRRTENRTNYKEEHNRER